MTIYPDDVVVTRDMVEAGAEVLDKSKIITRDTTDAEMKVLARLLYQFMEAQRRRE